MMFPRSSQLSNVSSSNSSSEAATKEPASEEVDTPFIWGVGIECSFLPHIDVDQFDWTQHNQFWRDDLKMIREVLGVTHLRYALPWHKIEVEPGQFDWNMADERISYCRELGIKLMMDVMHFGTPKWLPQAVGDPRFPEALERFTAAMVNRYKNDIKTWCPFNEPLVSALFSGDFGFWPPFSRKWRGYMPVLSRIVQSVNRSIAAIRRIQPEATVLLCDALENYQSRSTELQGEVAMRNMRRFVVLDLLSGRVDHHHPLYTWLTSFGFSELDLAFFRANPQMPDVIGLDYYPHSDWQIEMQHGRLRQRRADAPLGVYELGKAVYDRYGLPMMVTETSIDGPPIAREIWLGNMTDQIKQLREEGYPMNGLIWWPAFDQIDWDGALTHRIGKLHRVGLFTLNRQADGSLQRSTTPLAHHYHDIVAAGNEHVGEMAPLSLPAHPTDPQLPPLLNEAHEWAPEGPVPQSRQTVLPAPAKPSRIIDGETNGNGNGHGSAAETRTNGHNGNGSTKATDKFGIVVFSHLRWGFVWQRPQQFLSRFARHQPILFVEEPFFDLKSGAAPRLDLHAVMPNITVACPHCPPEMRTAGNLPAMLRQWVREAIDSINIRGEFDKPLLWYYSPMDSAWSLGHFENRGVVYDCMDELNQFTGAPKTLVDNERRLIENADVVFTGGYELWTKKKEQHENTHFYGCGVEFNHFNQAANPVTALPPDIDFMPRPILGWFGVVDERVDYHLLAEIARERPEWSIAVVGPVVKVDPNLLPHAPNLHWLGGRDYQQLPNYCAAFDVCMMAFAINKATEFINPTKALEYLATGKPVISTPVKDVVRQYADVVDIAKTPAEFIEAAERALTNPDKARIAAGLEMAKKASWESQVNQMRQNIKDALSIDNRRSKNVQPIADPPAGTMYKHTQGS